MVMNKELTNTEIEMLEKVSETSLMDFNKNIAKEVRLSGSEEERRAFEYVRNKLDSFGFKTQIILTKGYISLPKEAFLSINEVNYDCITHSMGQSARRLEAEVVDLSDGSILDFGKRDVQEKIVLMDGVATPKAVQTAAEHGAVGAVFVNGEHIHQMIVSPVWGNPEPETLALFPSIPVLSVNERDGNNIRRQLQIGQNRGVISAEVETKYRDIPTLIAEIKGKLYPEDFVMFSGHIDSWYFGAMDNASANSVMLEVARILSEYHDQLNRSLRLAFWSGHSHGRYAGSTKYCDAHWEEIAEHCVMHVNIDSAGGKGASVLTESKSMAETKDLAKNVIQEITGDIFQGSRFGRAGDQSFWGTGTPSLFMGVSEQPKAEGPAADAFKKLFGAGKSGGFGWWWHTTEDTIDKIDPDNLRRDCKIYLIVVYRLLSDSILPINQLSAILDIKNAINQWNKKAGDRFDLSLSLERISQLENSIREFQKKTYTVSFDDREKVDLINDCIMHLSRLLVPLNYVKTSIFHHDLALSQDPVPKLDKINQLVQLDRKSNEYQACLTSLERSVNEVNYTLKTAEKIVHRILHKL